jgi:hypothetical protein
MATIPNNKILAISTPYSQTGVLYESHKQHFGRENDRVLVWQAETRVMNPNVSEKVIQHEIEFDPDGASAEWLPKFRDDLKSAFSLEAIQASVIPGREELQASPAIATGPLSILQAAVITRSPLPLGIVRKIPLLSI